MKKKLLRKIAAFTGLTLCMASLAGCGSKTSDDQKTTSETTVSTTAGTTAEKTTDAQGSTEYTGEVRTVIVGIGNAFQPFCYLDENEKLAGYEYEVLKLVDEALPQYEFSYEPTAFKNLFVGLDTGAYDVAVQNMGWNKDRAEKYLYGDVSNFNSGGGYIIEAKAGRTDINTTDDLQGKIVGVSPTFNGAYLLEEYNAAHPENERIIIQYSDATTEQRWSDIVNGVIDATISNVYVHKRNADAFGDSVASYGTDILAEYHPQKSGRYLYSKDEEQLKKDVDAVLQGLLDDGTLSRLSLEWFGIDYASEAQK